MESLKSLVGSCNSQLDITEDAKRLYDDWYFKIENSVHSLRLETYSQRLMQLLAANEKKLVVNVELIKKVIALVNWQLEVRKELDPVDADNAIAKMEEKIRRQLERKRSMKVRELKQFCNAKKSGLWFFKCALKNLQDGEEIIFDKATKCWSLIP